MKLSLSACCWLVGFYCAIGLASPPDPPGNASPPDGAIDVPANAVLCVDVSDPQSEPLDVTFHGRELTGQPAEDFTIVVLPDTQYYSQTFPQVFDSQTEWIVANREARNIVFVSHVGDVVQLAHNPFEWANADAAMSRLDDLLATGLGDGIPYGIATGNHDVWPTLDFYNDTFPVTRFEDRAYYGGHYGGKNDNHYELFSAGGMEFIFFHIGWDGYTGASLPPVLDWADNLLKTHSDRRAILTAHSLLCDDTICPETLDAPFSLQGQLTYDALKDNPNLFLMLCGHAGHAGVQPRREDTFDGSTIHTLLSNYQRNETCPLRCGNGWLRILTFSPQNDEIRVETYSPWLDDYKTAFHHDFTLPTT
jgi:hypothetical protein